jgi:hypothetical protein
VGAPQDDDRHLMALGKFLILRRPHKRPSRRTHCADPAAILNIDRRLAATELCGNSERCRQRPAGCRASRVCGSLPSRRACSHRHYRSFGRQLPGTHRGRAPGVPQCIDCDRPRRAAPEGNRAVPRRAPRGCEICADSQTDSDQLCEGVLLRGIGIQVYQRGRRELLRRYRVLPVASNDYLDEAEQQHIIFDPIPRVDGIEASADPLFEPRANIYADERKAAPSGRSALDARISRAGGAQRTPALWFVVATAGSRALVASRSKPDLS